MLQATKLQNFLQNNLVDFYYQGGGTDRTRFPDFELYAYDYLQFADFELQGFLSERKDAQLINCISHLKRALDCQVDTFLHCYNLYKLFSDRNLGFEKKLDFLKATGVFNSRTLTRLNTIRNRMEHKYEIPKIQDIEIYYDLVAAFIAVLDRTIIVIPNGTLEFGIGGTFDNSNGDFVIGYESRHPAVSVWWKLNDMREDLSRDTSDIAEFAYFFKVLLLLYQREIVASDQYILRQITIS